MKKKYSFLLKPINVLIDFLFINIIFFWISDIEFKDGFFLTYINVNWFIIAYFTKYYRVTRVTHVIRIFILYLTQIGVFFLAFFSYFGLFREGEIVNNQFVVFASIAVSVFILKFLFYYSLRFYRELGNNYRNVVVVGLDRSSKKIINFFKSEDNYGYNYFGFFSETNSNSKEFLGETKNIFKFITSKNIDEIYCSSSVDKDSIRKIRKLSIQYRISFKLIPDFKELYSKNFDVEYYGVLPILNPKKLPFELLETQILKRVFDIFFSILIIFFVLSWLIPILFIIIKIDSKGPLFFYQDRSGINGVNFSCYKFRSMSVNKYSDIKQVSKNDTRVTKVGSFLRKTSIDELPQFFNVFLGDMSVVGPRPHMNKQSLQFEKEVNNYLKRYEVKPGITGLAQISGYRGEIRKKSDIENRVRLDVFYIENWSFFLDIKIVFQTVFNVFKGEEKAY